MKDIYIILETNDYGIVVVAAYTTMDAAKTMCNHMEHQYPQFAYAVHRKELNE